MNRNDVAVIRADQTEFYRANVSRLLQYAYVRCGDRQWAEDLVHETFFVRLFRAWSTERAAVADRRGYAARTLLNCFRDDLRRRSARPPTDLVADHEDRPSSVPVAREKWMWRIRFVPPCAAGAAATGGHLPFYYEDLSLAETARVMGIGPASVHNYHSLAKKRLRTELAHLAPPAKERRNER